MSPLQNDMFFVFLVQVAIILVVVVAVVDYIVYIVYIVIKALWCRTTKNPDASTGPLVCLLARFALLTHSLTSELVGK